MSTDTFNDTARRVTTIPGHHIPPIVYTLFAIYVPAFCYNLSHTQPFEIVSDRIHVTTISADAQDATHVDPRYANGEAAKHPGEELVVEEEVEIEEKDAQVLRTLLTGRPSPRSYLWSAVTFLHHLVLVAMVVDLVYRAKMFYPGHELSFARVGFVSDNSANILVRQPDLEKLPVFLSYRRSDEPLFTMQTAAQQDVSWKNGGKIEWLDERTDFTGTLTVTGLKADTRYQYVVSNHTGFFTTAPRVGQLSNRASSTKTFTFLQSSCIKLNFPYNPLNHPLSSSGLKYLAQTLESVRAQFILFLGDFIYIDVPKRHGTTMEDYRREYRHVYSSPDWPAAAKELPWLHVYDDHELANDWDGNTTGVFRAANDPYEHYHTSVNPPAVRRGESYFSFTQGPATFFMLDTRRYRSPNDRTNGSDPITGEATKTLLGAQQLVDLLSWLKRPEPQGVRWKILVSSVPFTKNWWYGAQDTWRGYLGERQLILEAMWEVGLRGGIGVVILSGDRHEFAATAFPPPPEGKEEKNALGTMTIRKRWPLSATVHEFSASPLNMFYLPIRTYRESSTSTGYVSDVCIKYIPDGNSKLGAVAISNPLTSDQSVLHYRLFVDGVERWSYTLTTPPDVRGGGRSKDAIWG